MGYQVMRQLTDVLQSMSIQPEIEKTGYGQQMTFAPHKDAKGRDVRVSLAYVKGIFERVPSVKGDLGRGIYVWQLQFVYPFKIDTTRHSEALRLINSINPRLAMPGFHLLEEESSIAFGYCLLQQQAEMNHDLLVDILGCALNQYDHFLPEFEALCQPSWGGRS